VRAETACMPRAAASTATSKHPHRPPAARATSREWYRRFVLDDAARAVFTGRVGRAPAKPRHSDAQQSNRNLLLSRDAEADSRRSSRSTPTTSSVSHGQATGQLDPEQLFYLRSRGLDEPRAARPVVYAFAAPTCWLARMRLRAAAPAAVPRSWRGGWLPGRNDGWCCCHETPQLRFAVRAGDPRPQPQSAQLSAAPGARHPRGARLQTRCATTSSTCISRSPTA